MIFDLHFTTDYHQFYITDKDGPGDTNSEKFWTEQAYAGKLAIDRGGLGIFIENEDGNVKCQVEFLDSRSINSNFDEFDHVVEGSIEINSGILQVLDCPHSEIELEVNVVKGDYRVRVYSKDLKLAYDENPGDLYRIEIWRESYSDKVILKRHFG